jgi:hypothetical protein
MVCQCLSRKTGWLSARRDSKKRDTLKARRPSEPANSRRRFQPLSLLLEPSHEAAERSPYPRSRSAASSLPLDLRMADGAQGHQIAQRIASASTPGHYVVYVQRVEGGSGGPAALASVSVPVEDGLPRSSPCRRVAEGVPPEVGSTEALGWREQGRGRAHQQRRVGISASSVLVDESLEFRQKFDHDGTSAKFTPCK